jgi:ribosomal RNA assembly protein
MTVKAARSQRSLHFAILFPRYGEKCLREVWSAVTRVFETPVRLVISTSRYSYNGMQGIACAFDLLNGSMSACTTRKTFYLYILLKSRNMIKLLARGVAINQAV